MSRAAPLPGFSFLRGRLKPGLSQPPFQPELLTPLTVFTISSAGGISLAAPKAFLNTAKPLIRPLKQPLPNVAEKRAANG